jgi:hypothetical protein
MLTARELIEQQINDLAVRLERERGAEGRQLIRKLLAEQRRLLRDFDNGGVASKPAHRMRARKEAEE